MNTFPDVYKCVWSKGFLRISHLKEEFDILGNILACLPRVKREDRYHCHVCTVNMKLRFALHRDQQWLVILAQYKGN